MADDTLVFFGHEYTEENLRFAASVEPGNPDIEARREQVRKLREAGKPTAPSTIGLEKKTNPFLRADTPAIRRTLNMNGAPAVQVFAELRRRKDAF
jgi:hydroxyacylglutathione hydrolase